MSGFDYTFVFQVPQEYICLICQCPMRKPVQTKCGHRFCKYCLQESMKRLQECPIDRNRLEESLAKDIYPDVASERTILDFQVKCSHENNGCEWIGELRSVEAHEETCAFRRVTCPNDSCDVIILRKDLQRHVTECPRRRMECDYCKESYAWCLKEDHFKECSRYPCTCVQECGQNDIPRNEMNDHIKRVCPRTIVDCTFAHVGCQVKVQKNGLSQHVQANIESHLNLSCKTLQELQATREATEKEINEFTIELQLLQTAHDTTKKQLLELQATATESQINISCKKLQELQAEHKATKTQMEELQAEHDATKTLLQELQATRTSTEKELYELKTERVTRIELRQLQTAHDDTKKKLEILTFSFVFICAGFAWFAYTDKEPNELWSAARQMNVCSGQFIWKFTEFEQRLKKAKDGIQTNFYSNSFHTGPYGYKMRVSILPNGVRDGENTHLSVSIYLESGDYDAILHWPFKKKVLFTLVDQQADQTQRKDIQLAFDPKYQTDVSRNFVRPSSERNDGSLYSKFISHNDLRARRYLVDDTLFIQVKVEQDSTRWHK